MSRTISAGASGRGHIYVAVLATLVALLSGCAGSTIGSGVGDSFHRDPPFYAGAFVASGGAIAHVPVSYQRGSAQAPIFEPSGAEGSPVAALLAEMNAFVDRSGRTVRIAAAPRGTAPDVQFSCERMPGDDCEDADRRRPMRLAVARPAREWVEWAAAEAAAAQADRILVLTLEVGNYLPRQRNLLGRKEVPLGTGHAADVPWLTSLDRPVSVLQLTGALMDSEGRAVRIGAEGLLARRTNLLLASVGAQTLITDDDVESLRTARRQDMPGQPLVWEVALAELLQQLTGR